MENTFCIIMAGGIGSRFWPISTSDKPKQFLDVLGVGKTLLQLTFERLSHVCPLENFFIVSNQQYKQLVLEQLPSLSEQQVLCEPMRRNTAPCIAYGVHEIKKINKKANIIVAPSDHLIINESQFISVLNAGLKLVEEHDILLTLGIKPTRPDTGYGYIQLEKHSFTIDSHIVNKVKTFTEKPNEDLAKFFVESKEFFWNSGIFLWSVQSISSAFQTYLPIIHNLFEDELANSEDESEELDKIYSACPSISIDYGIMEKAENVHVMQTDFGWSDLGTWGALYENLSLDDKSNAVVGDSVFVYESRNNMIFVPNNKVVVIDGLDDFIVVDTDDKLLITKRSNEQKIRKFVNDIVNVKGDAFV